MGQLLGLVVVVVVIVAASREVGRTGASTWPDDVDVGAADEEVDVLEAGVEDGDEETSVVGGTLGTMTVVEVVVGTGIFEESLNVLAAGGEAVTVGLTMTVVVEPSTPKKMLS